MVSATMGVTIRWAILFPSTAHAFTVFSADDRASRCSKQVHGSAAVENAPARPSTSDADSRARTHLANERTFLAWLRTGLSLVAVGLGAAGLLPQGLVPNVHLVTFTSVTLVIVGTLMVVFGSYRFIRAHQDIERGRYVPTLFPVVMIGALVAFIALLAVPLVLELR